MSRWLMIAGAMLFALGVALHFAPWLFNWFGKLPGDLRFESGRGRLFLPFTSMLIVSLLLTVLVNLFRR